jgi:hypothetical protein
MAVQQPGKSCELAHLPVKGQTSQLIDWFAEGQTFEVEFAGVVMTVRYVCRKGRRARIAITGPAGAVFRSLDSSETVAS